MLTEQLVASIGVPLKTPGTHVAKDAAIFINTFQPASGTQTIFKKSATPPNCLAISQSHIFAAQVDKAVVHVYSREKNNQEATVPFPERITALLLICQDAVLVLGTADGRLFAWEVASGRLVATKQAHLQAVAALAVDGRSNFLLSASADSSVHVWNISDLLSFSTAQDTSPVRTFSNHRSKVTALAVGHSDSACNFAVSVSEDKTCLVWDYRTNTLLRTFLLPGVASSISLDPADRAFYLGYEDGTVQQIDLYQTTNGGLEAVQNGNGAANPIQPKASSRWKLQDASLGSILCMSLSFDGTTLITGHESGALLSWDTNRGSYLSTLPQSPLPGPVANVAFLPVTGFADPGDKVSTRTRVTEIIKPKFGAHTTDEGFNVPGNYALTVQLSTDLSRNNASSELYNALTGTAFPTSILDQGLSELASWGQNITNAADSRNGDSAEHGEDFMSLDEQPGKMTLEQENALLKTQIAALRRVQATSLQSVHRLSEEKKALVQREQARLVARNGDVSSEDESG
jgi:pre-rRNA-processing protein IPI3